jgi:CHAD domain-containing protein
LVDAGYRVLAAQYVRKQAKQLRGQFDGIRGAEEIEFLHRARVASRRLWAAMLMFGECFKRKQVKRWKKAIRRIRTELSEARDKDVQIELLREIGESLTEKASSAGICRLLVEWENRRECLQSAVLKAIKQLEREGTLKKMRKAAKRILSKAESQNIQPQAPSSFARAEQEILERLEELIALQDCLTRPDDCQSHHAMRIAAKRLRYTMEILQPMYGDRLDGVLDAIKQVQTLLGEVHDCDVWQAELDQYAAGERRRIKSYFGHEGPFARLMAGVEYLRQDRQRRRQQCFADLVKLWDELEAREAWENVVSIVQSHGQPTEAPDAGGDGKGVAQSQEAHARHYRKLLHHTPAAP